MKETIILAPGASTSELLKTMARFGKNTFNCRIVNAAELAELALQRSGLHAKGRLITMRESASLIDRILSRNRENPAEAEADGIGYWKNSGYSDAGQLAQTLRSLRLLIAGSEQEEYDTLCRVIPQGSFAGKNEGLLAVYRLYLEQCRQNDLADSVHLLRQALTEAEPLTDVDLIVTEDYPCAPLELALAEKLTGRPCRPVSLISLFGREAAPMKIESYTAAYGSTNEAEAVIAAVCREHPDSCVIAVTDTRLYTQLLLELCRTMTIPVTFGCGIPIHNARPAAFLRAMNHWNSAGFHGVDALTAFLCGSFFDTDTLRRKLELDWKQLHRVMELAGNLRLCFDCGLNAARIRKFEASLPENSEERELFHGLRGLAGELEKGPVQLLRSYASLRTEDENARKLDCSALSTIIRSLEAYLCFRTEQQDCDLGPVVPEILAMTVCAEAAAPGKLHVTDLHSCSCALRENVFVLGLSADNFPGRPKENHIVLDDEYLRFSPAAPTSYRLVEGKRLRLKQTLQLAAALGCRIRLYYPCYHAAELKKANFSSVLFELYREEHGADRTVQDFTENLHFAGYHDHPAPIDRTYREPDAADPSADAPSADRESAKRYWEERGFSPTAIETFFGCPKRFRLKYLMRMPEPEEDDPFVVINAARFGDLAHLLMEEYANRPDMDEAEFMAFGERLYDNWLSRRPPVSDAYADKERGRLREMMELAYRYARSEHGMEPEQELSVMHEESGVRISGRPDRLELQEDGRYLVVDYKSKKQIEHMQDDVHSCLQVMLYAYMAEKGLSIDIAGCEYRYLRLGKRVSCAYNEVTRDGLTGMLTQFREALETDCFPTRPNEKSCRYCRFAAICGKGEQEDSQ